MRSLLDDVRRSARALIANPTFVVLAALCLGIGIGCTTLMFSVINAVLLNPVHSVDPEGLVVIGERHEEGALVDWQISLADFLDWESSASDYAELGAMRPSAFAIGGSDATVRVDGAFVTGRYFSVLGVEPIIGRSITTSDISGESGPVVALSESYWHARYGGDRAIIGRSVRIDDTPYTIVGVIPDLRDIGMPGSVRSARVWLPLDTVRQGSSRNDRSLSVFARLPESVSIESAASRLNLLANQSIQARPENAEWTVIVQSIGVDASGATRAMLLLGLSAAALVLVIACANVANLTLARASRRRHEFAIRTAIGAERRRIARQLLSESVLVSVVGTALGIIIARLGRDYLLQSISVASGAPPFAVPFDASVLTLTIGLTFLTTVLFGLYPAFATAGEATTARLTEFGTGTTAARGQSRMRGALVVGQIGCSLALLIGASLLMRSFLNLASIDGGAETEHVTSIRMSPVEAPGAPGRVTEDVDGILEALAAIPGVEMAAAGDVLPLRGGGSRSGVSLVAGDIASRTPTITYAGVTPGFFEAFHIGLLRGRVFGDDIRARNAAVINESLVNLLWPNQDPLGQQFQLDAERDRGPMTVVGISADVYSWDRSNRPVPTAYVDLRSSDSFPTFLFTRTNSDAPLVNAEAISKALETLGFPSEIDSITPMDEVARDIFWRQEMFGEWMSILGVFALTLTIVGIYGVLAYLVAQREREIGIRMALGADRRTVLQLILRQGAKLTGSGIALGILVAYLLGTAMRGLLFGVQPLDLVLFSGAAIVLAAIAMIASAAPAFRATRIDPNVLLRN